MRVVINLQCTLGRRTGVGHYTSELLRCLRQQAGPDRIDGYPHEWLWRSRRAWARIRRRVEDRPAETYGQAPVSAPPPVSLGGRVYDYVRSWGRRLRRWHHRAHFTSGFYDLYHEPNHIPIPTDLPTVVTICDLSSILHPE